MAARRATAALAFGATEAAEDHSTSHADPVIPAGEMCPSCNEMTLTHQGSCTLCTSCGHSTCY
jgi:hypothetical protein